MGLRVDHYQTPSDETHKVVNVFDKYIQKKFSALEYSFQIMTYSPPNGIMSSLMFHFTQFLDLMLGSALNDKLYFSSDETPLTGFIFTIIAYCIPVFAVKPDQGKCRKFQSFN